jgi:hypothetical protein
MSPSCRWSRRPRRRWILEALIGLVSVVGVAVLPGCACVPEREPGQAIELASLSSGEGGRARGPGATPAAPIERCGPRQSYDYLANRFTCPGAGGNPFEGNWRAAASHRVGSAPAHGEGHRVDVYEVPCRPGPVHVFVDMYSCRSAGP